MASEKNFWPLESGFLMRKSEKKGPNFLGRLLLIDFLNTFLESSCKFRQFDGYFFDLTGLQDPCVIQKLQTAIWILLKLEFYRGTALTKDFTTKYIFQSFRNASNYFVVFFFVWGRTADITLFARPDYLLVHKWNAGRGYIYLHFLSSLTFTFKIR